MGSDNTASEPPPCQPRHFSIRRYPTIENNDELLDREQRELLLHGKKTIRGRTALSAKSVKETFTLVKAALRQAKKWNYIAANPAEDIDVPSIKRKRKNVLQLEQLEGFLESITSNRDYPLIVFAIASGCRRGEILALRVEDVNFETGEARISDSLEETKTGLRVKSTKSGKPRSFTLPACAFPVLEQQLQFITEDIRSLGSAYQQNGLLFPDREGAYQRPDRVGDRINLLLKTRGLQTTLHGLRHFHASWLLSNKVPLPVVSEPLGHANPSITLAIYSHVMRSDDKVLAATLDAGLEAVIPGARKLGPVLVTGSATGGRKKGAGN
jgi:integrase